MTNVWYEILVDVNFCLIKKSGSFRNQKFFDIVGEAQDDSQSEMSGAIRVSIGTATSIRLTKSANFFRRKGLERVLFQVKNLKESLFGSQFTPQITYKSPLKIHLLRDWNCC